MGEDRSILVFEGKRSIGARQIDIRIVERTNGSNVFPVAIEQVCVNIVSPDRHREDLFPEILVVTLGQQIDQDIAIEDVNPHVSEAIAAVALNAS